MVAGELLGGFLSVSTLTIPDSGMQMPTVAHFVSTKSGIVTVDLEAWRLRANMAFRVHKTTFFFLEIWDCKCGLTPELSRKKRVLRGS